MEKGKNGFEKKKLSVIAHYQFYKDFPNASRILTYIGFIKKIDEDSPGRKEWLKFDDNMFEGFAKIIEEGKRRQHKE